MINEIILYKVIKFKC